MTPVVEFLVGVAVLVVGSALTAISGFCWATWRNSRKALRLLQGEEEVEGDGVLARLRAVEEQLADVARRCKRNSQAIEAARYTDGGKDRE